MKWNVGETYDDLHNPTGVTEIEDGSGFVVAFVPRHKGSARADERASFPPMIAAAPELYAALKEANAWISHGNGLSPGKQGAKCDTLCDAEALIDAALAKAEGKATT